MTKGAWKRAAIALCLLAFPLSAFATVTFTFDQANQTVTRPTSGSVTINFSGTLTADVGDTFDVATLNFPFNSAGNVLIGTLIDPFTLGDVIRFSFDINATTPLGLYDLDFALVSPAVFEYNYRDAAGAPHSLSIPFSVNVVATAAPEPATLSLLGFGIVGLAFSRRRKLH